MTEGGLIWRVRWALAYVAYFVAAKLHSVGYTLDPRPGEGEPDEGSGGNYL